MGALLTWTTTRPRPDYSTQRPPLSTSSSLSFTPFWYYFSKSPNTPAITVSAVEKSLYSQPHAGLDCKLVWGITGKSFKPVLLFTRPAPYGQPTSANLLVLQMGKSFKTQCIDEPDSIIQTLLHSFCYARSVIPSTSRFAASLTDKNYLRLRELQAKAIQWKQNGQLDSGILAKGSTLQTISGDTLKRLLDQPNIFHILGEAVSIFSCLRLGIPSPSTSDLASSVGRSRFLSWKTAATPKSSSDCSLPLLEKHPYHPVLQSCLSELLPQDPILSLSVETLHALIDRMTLAQLLINIWFAPYQKNGEVDESISDGIACALAKLDKENQSEKEAEELIQVGSTTSANWIEDAAKLRRLEHDFNIWNLALQRCEKIKTSGFIF